MSQPPGATKLISPIFLGKRSPGKEIGLAGIMYSIFCRVLHRRSSLSQRLTRSELAKCRIRLFFCDARKICGVAKIISGREAGVQTVTKSCRQKKEEARRLLLKTESLYCGVDAPAPSAFLAWRCSRISCAQIFCCSGVITAHTWRRISLRSSFTFCARWSSVRVVSFFIAFI
jgi:hypothetical protein